MIATSYIQGNLRSLDRAYQTARSQRFSFFFAKLAILELCGWIEVSMDDIILMHSSRKIVLPQNVTFVEREVVRRTYGFEYNRHFRGMLTRLLGVVECERIEKKISAQVMTKFVAQLDQLKIIRDQLAHTYIKGATVTIDAPSVTRNRFADLYAGLAEYDRFIRAL